MSEKLMLAKPGDRVGVFHSTTDTSALIYGYGVYEGDEVPPEGIMIPQVGPAHSVGIFIPKLRLDDGTVVWGCEVWWAAESVIQSLCEGLQIVRVSIESVRKKALNAWEEANADLGKRESELPQFGSSL